MIRRMLLLLFALAPMIAASALLPSAEVADSSWSQHLQAARAALARDDAGSAREHLLRVDSLVGGHTGAKSALATLAARDGRREDALRWLRALAATGLTRSLAGDSSFARWRDEPEFAALEARLTANAEPLARAPVEYSLGDSALLAEDIAWNARAARFLVSSIHRRKIVAIDSSGRVSDYTTAGADSAWGIYGLALDARRGVLWASSAAGPECEGWNAADSGRTALLAYDLDTARLRTRIELPRRPSRQVLGDLTVGPDGTVYASESVGGAVYRLAPGAPAIETLVPPGTFRSPQGLVVAAHGARLYVADYARGIAVVHLRRRGFAWLRKPYALASGGFDGLYRDGSHLIAIQNGTAPRRVVEMDLDAAGTRILDWRVLEQASERLGEPNHGVLVGRDLYLIGDSGWDRVGADGALRSPPGTRAPVVLRLPLDPEVVR